MTITNHRLYPTSRSIAIALGFLISGQLYGQSAPSPSTPKDVSKNNGSRDGAAPSVERDPNSSDIVALTPFAVNTSKDVGYAAGNTLSGGRVDTPLAITPGSISV